MAHVINPIDIKPSTILNQTQRKLICMPECFNTKIYDADEIQRRINNAAEVRTKLEEEIAKRNDNIKYINLLG